MTAILPEADARIVRAWSVVICRDMLGTPSEVAAYLDSPVADVAERMTRLRAIGQLPRETLRGAVMT